MLLLKNFEVGFVHLNRIRNWVCLVGEEIAVLGFSLLYFTFSLHSRELCKVVYILFLIDWWELGCVLL